MNLFSIIASNVSGEFMAKYSNEMGIVNILKKIKRSANPKPILEYEICFIWGKVIGEL